MRRRDLLISAVVSAVALVAVSGGLARAVWHDGGSGTGSATGGGMQMVEAVAFTGGEAPSTSLYPGGTADVIVRVNNPNAFAVKVVAVSGTGGAATADIGHASCTTTGVAFTDQTGMTLTVAAGTTVVVTLPNAATMSTLSQSACQGATFSIPVSLEARTS